MRRRWAWMLALLLCLSGGAAGRAEEPKPQRVAALSGSFAEIWLLAGGTLTCATQDAWEERGLALDESVVNVGSLKQPSAELLLQAEIDLALLTPTLEGQKALGQTLTDAGVRTEFFELETFGDYLAMLKRCTKLTGHPEAYETYGAAVQAQVDAAIARCADQPSPTVLLIRAYSTGAKAKNSRNNMTGAMLKDLGCVNIADQNESLLEDLSLEAILTADPDFIFVTTMGADDAALAKLAETLQASPAWASLTAVKQGRYHVLPKELFHYKPNARWGESYDLLAGLLYD